MTTGTFTPTPSNWVTTTPLPPFIPFANLSPSPTATPTPTRLTVLQSAIRPIPAQFFNRIIFQRGDRGNPTFVVIDPDGQNQGLVTDRSVYETAVARDAFSPEGTFLLYNAPSIDFPDTLQIWIQYQGIPTAPPQRLTWHRIGLAYAPAWAPCCNKFAYVSSETGRDEIWLFDLDAKKTQKLTTSAEWNWNQFPSWSPDSKQIVFSSDRGRPGMFTDIWVMNADGTNARKISDGIRDAWAPVWIKWKQ
jgi:TolB protein